MNIAGPYKTDDCIEACFFIGLRKLLGKLYLEKKVPLFKDVLFLETGPEAFICVDCDKENLKEWAVEIEDSDRLGRLFDIDIIGVDGNKVDRKQERSCLLCSNSAKICSSRRIHSLESIQDETNKIVRQAFSKDFTAYVSSLAVKALLYEVSATPKPGLVDRNNSGSHKDMDFYTFIRGSVSLFSYFSKAFELGSSVKDCKVCFEKLKALGKIAEDELFFSTDGVNTHKGAVFTIGMLVCAAGIAGVRNWNNPELICSLCAKMAEGLVQKELIECKISNTNGEKVFHSLKITGIRGEMEKGLPSVYNGLILLEKLISAGKTEDEASAFVLLQIITCIRDTCLISRGGESLETDVKQKAKDILGTQNFDRVKELDAYCIDRNLSPGGSADLLSACWFLYFLEEEVKR